MALIIADRVVESSTTTGTGAFSLAAAYTGYRRFSAVCSTNDTLYYVIEAIDGNGNPSGEWETGLGTYSGANTLTRTNVSASSNANAAVNFAAGTKRVSLNATAAHLAALQPLDSDLTALGGLAGVRGDVIYRDASQWQRLAAGTSGQFLKTLGAGADPAWATVIGTTWALVGSGQTATGVYDQAVDGSKANVDFTGLSGYNELLIVARSLTASVAGLRSLRVSVDNGSNFFTTAGDHKSVAVAGTEGNDDAFNYHTTTSTAARSLTSHILNTKGPVKYLMGSNGAHVFTASSSDINAIRIYNSGGGNITGGTVQVFGR